MQRYFLHLAYNGIPFHGWQVQPNASTVQETLNQALSTILRDAIHVVGAGRTDTGVHASCMYAHFSANSIFSVDELVFKLNRFLPQEIVVYKVMPVMPEAHARFDALSRSYEYRMHFGKSPFLLGRSYMHYRDLDVSAMNLAAQHLIGAHNFRAFEKSRAQENTGICDVAEAVWKQREKEVVFHITANRFLRNMVRAIVGTLIEVGEGKRTPDSIPILLQTEKRSNAGTSVPPHGLYLSNISYPDSIFI